MKRLTKKIIAFDEHLDKQYGKKGTKKREKFATNSVAFRLGEMLKEERKKANLTQEELAQKTGTKKTYISRIEAGKSDIQLSTFYRLVEVGLSKRIIISIN
jgi:ribosome-binding protein aMBF1 (putative translation factor)